MSERRTRSCGNGIKYGIPPPKKTKTEAVVAVPPKRAKTEAAVAVPLKKAKTEAVAVPPIKAKTKAAVAVSSKKGTKKTKTEAVPPKKPRNKTSEGPPPHAATDTNINNSTLVLRKVFEKLDFKSIASCRLVCKLWEKEVADSFESEGAVRLDYRLLPIRQLSKVTRKGQGSDDDDLELDILKELDRLKLPRRNLAFYPNRAWDLLTFFSEVKMVQRLRLHMIDYKRPVVNDLKPIEGKCRKKEGQKRPILDLPNLEKLIIDSQFNKECLELYLPKDFTLDLPKLHSLAIRHDSVDVDMNAVLNAMRASSIWMRGLRVLKIDVQSLSINPEQVEELKNMDWQLSTLELSVVEVKGHSNCVRVSADRYILSDLIENMSETLEVLKITAKYIAPRHHCCGPRPSEPEATKPTFSLQVVMKKLRVLELTGGVEVGKIQPMLGRLPALTTCIYNCKSEDNSIFIKTDKTIFPLIREFQYPRTFSNTIIPKNTVWLFPNLNRLTLTVDHERIMWAVISLLKNSSIEYLKMIIIDQKPRPNKESRYCTDEQRPKNRKKLFQDWKDLREVVFTKGDRKDSVDKLMRSSRDNCGGRSHNHGYDQKEESADDYSSASTTPLAVFKRLHIKDFISDNIEIVQLVNFGPAPIQMDDVKELVLQSPNLRRLALKNCNICDAEYTLMGRSQVLDRISKLNLANSELKVELELNFEEFGTTELDMSPIKRPKSKQSQPHPAIMQVDVLKMIFGMLNFDSLLKCRRVCRSWRELSEFAFASKGRVTLDGPSGHKYLPDGNQAWYQNTKERKMEQMEYETKLLKQVSKLKLPIRNICINPLQLTDPPKFLNDAGLAEKLKFMKLNFTGVYNIPEASSDADSDSDSKKRPIKVKDARKCSQVDFPELEEIMLDGDPSGYSPKSGFSVPKLHQVTIGRRLEVDDQLIEIIKLRPDIVRALTSLISKSILEITPNQVKKLVDLSWKLDHLELRHFVIYQKARGEEYVRNQNIHSLSPLIERMSDTLEVLILSGWFTDYPWNCNANYKRLHPPDQPNLCSLEFLSVMGKLRVLEFHGAIEVGHIEDILIKLPQLTKCLFNCKKDWKNDVFRRVGSEVAFPNIREFQYPRDYSSESIPAKTVQLFPNLVKLTLTVDHEKYLWSLASSELSNLTSLTGLTLLIQDAPDGSFKNGRKMVRSCTSMQRPKQTTRIFQHWKSLKNLTFWKMGMQDYRGKEILADSQFFNYSIEKDKLYTAALTIFEEFPIQSFISDNISSLELLDFAAAPIRIGILEKLLLGSPSLRYVRLKDCVVRGDDGQILNREEILGALSQMDLPNGDKSLDVHVVNETSEEDDDD